MAVESGTIKALFLAALEKATPAGRAAFLDEACAGDAALRGRVEELLQAHGRPDHLLDRPAVEHLGAGTPEGAVLPAPPEAAELLAFLAPTQKPGSLGRLDHYEVLEVIGRGGMGLVLRAFDEKLHRVVAIKVLAPHLAANGSARQRFVREARAAAAVPHDNIIAIYAVEDSGPIPYLVMQCIDGKNLQAKLDGGGPLALKVILRIGLQIADGLAAAHRQGLVHRDVKPANILLENGIERVKITDFGLARAVDDASLTQSGVVAGTPAYMSPEQARGERADHRSDLFSLGSVLYALCTGHPPFRASGTLAVLKRVCEDTPRPIREVNADIPDWLTALIARLLAKEPAQRFQTAAEVAGLLSQHLTHLQQPGMEQPQHRAPGPTPQQGNGGVWWLARWVGFAFLVFFLCSVSLWWVFHRGNPPPDRRETTGAVPGGPQPWQPRPIPSPEELAGLPAPADALRREDIPAELLEKAGGGDKDKAPRELVAVFGEDRHAGGDMRNHLYSVAISPDGKTLAFGGIDKVVWQLDLATGKPRSALTWKPRSAEDYVYTLAFSPDGKVLACGGGAGSVVLWDVTTGVAPRLLASPDVAVTQIAFSPDGALLATAGDNNDEVVRLWNVATGQLVRTLRPGPVSWCVAFSPDGKTLAAGLESGEVRVWDVAAGGEVASFSGLGGRVRWLGFHADGRSLVAAGGFPKHVVYVWDLATRTPRHRLPGHGSGVLSGAWRADGRLLITAGSTDGTVRFWDLSGDVPRSRALPVIPPDVPWLHGVALSPEGRHLAVCNPNGTVYVLRLARRGEVLQLPE